ncbi:MAG: amino acid adenylation domain-containing protein [Pelatocladus maniniholoensis HA4357-MV3]|uniref:Amino acid adenylation domain-containing protein n=1 Tax=Pelatocladus maniniholoensis HA4357-MV3 TaxID=1117104 RepID=A0A9E3LVH7_9NOST|nr:amino acid adenylation domain-containing protein [Pelatocladus maniniholoensis HA4357-MV3]
MGVKNKNIEDFYPLSPMQQGILFHSLADTKSSVYFEQLSWTLEGKLNTTAFRRAWQYVVERHAILRTCFIWEGLKEPVQIVHRQVSLPWQEYNWQHLSSEKQQQNLELFWESDRSSGFKLTHPPLMRLTLIQLSENSYNFTWSNHHLLLDGWSTALVFKEVIDCYKPFSNKQDIYLETIRPYRDYIVWLQQQNLSEAEIFWRQTLQGFTTPTQLSVNKLTRKVLTQTDSYQEQEVKLSVVTTAALRQFAMQHQLTLNTLVQGAWALLLSRYSGQEDVVFGAVTSGRSATLAKIESMVGLFINTLPIRVQVPPEENILPWLDKIRDQLVEVGQYEYCPLVKIQGWSEVPKGLSLFESIVVFENYPIDASLQQSDINLEIKDFHGFEKTNYPITLTVIPGEELLLKITSDESDRFNIDTLTRMLGHLQTLLEGMVTNPQQRLCELSLLTESERHQLLVEWNQTQAEYPQQYIHELLEAQVEKTPDAIAVVFEDQQLTYRELNARANQLGHYLRSQGVKPEVLVGICVERSLDMVIGLLGILKAGGAYIPLDPSYPKQRLEFILEDAKASVLLTQTSLLKAIPQHKAQVVCLDADDQLIAQQSQENLLCELTTDNLAYIIYTSGSTGKPKGVQIPHRALSNFLNSMKQTPGLSQHDTLLALTTYSFDIAALELFLPIIVGGRLVITSREIASDAIQLSAQITDSKATVIQATPATWQLLLTANWSGNQQLKILCGGEALPAHLANQLLQRCASLWNMYGPTETTIWSAASQVKAQGKVIPIGQPIDNTQLYILDKYNQLVPVGVPGELHIAGQGLARGYFNRPDLTAEKFIPNPFNEQPGTSLYKTGDLARYLPNGEIEYIGRIDHQVKIRGFRIELGEIEAVISQYSQVRETVVVAHKHSCEQQCLVAYLVLNPNHQGSNEEMTKLQTEQISQWQMVFDSEKDIFKQIDFAHDPTFNISLWKSSYGGLPISEEEMHEWVDHTVERILALKPDRVLEIGCGNGLLLFQIAPFCSQYFGTDFSKAALHYTQQVLAMPEHNLPQVRVLQRMADNFEGLLSEAFDTIIINSVVQYFPSVDYLLRVLEGAVNTVKPGGSIFVGDLRSLILLEAFHTSVELHNAPSSLSTVELQQRVQQAISQEEELVIDPAFFIALKHHLPQISYVQIQPKRGHHQNELTKFRYDVIIHVGTKVDVVQEFPWLDWQEQRLTLTSVRQLLESTQPEILGLRNVPNTRLLVEIKAVELLASDSQHETVSNIHQALNSINNEFGLNPESLWALKQELPYDIDINWANSGVDGSYDVIFHRYKTELLENTRRCVQYFPGEKACFKPWNFYANNPLQSKFARQILPWLRNFLESKLPNYMIPTNFVILDSLPLTPNGKVDRKALPAPELTQISSSNIIPSSTPIENLLVGIWAEVLGIDKVGIDHNFFELGGHSLIATRVISQIRQVFQVELPLGYLFEKPTIAGLAKVIEKVIQADSTVEVTDIERIVRSQQLPLSFAQQRLWFLDQLEPNSSFYNIAAAVRLKGRLNVAALQQSFNEIISRHEALRTNFQTIEGQPIAFISEAMPFTLAIFDISKLPANQQQAEVKQQASQEAQKPFDLKADLLLRVKLLRLHQEEHIILLTIHHIVSDGWSMGVLVRELATLYQAFCNRQPSPLPILPIQYVDFAAWQRQHLQGEVLKTQISYWLQQLKNAPKVLELPTDHPRPAIQTFRGATYSFELSDKLSFALNKLSQQQGSTLFMTLLAVFQTLLWRYTGSEDIAIGSPIANRNRAEIEGLIGFFVNTLVLRTKLAGNPTFSELLKRVREVALGAYAHQDLPFELLVEELQPERDLSHTPLFQVMFVLQNAPMSALELPGLTVSLLEDKSNTAKFDLSLYMTHTTEGLLGTLEYNTDLFEESSIQRMVRHLQTLLEAIVANPQQRLSELPLLTQIERHQLLREWNQTQAEYPQQCIHELFEAQVEKTPDTVAVVFEDQQLTYRELNARANQLGHYLRSQGVKPEVLVGICVERSLDMVIGLLGILKAGGAYIPLDPSYPKQRLEFILEDAKASVLLTQTSLLKAIPQHKAQVVCLDADDQLIAQQSQENLLCELTTDNLAYIIYTSGSTGKPKGVQIPHRALSNFLNSMKQTPGLSQHDTLLALTTYSFDIAALELFLPIIVGGRLVITSREIASDAIQLSAQITDSKATVIQATPATWQLLLTANWSGNQQLKILCGGEALPAHLANQLLQRCASLWNMYGPTETTIWSAASQVKAQGKVIPIGQPIDNTQLYILDKYNQLVPVGVPGELHIAGQGLARGYFNRPDLTAEKFIPNPFNEQPGTSLYKTGDLARYLPNGEIEYIGRIDHQVKIRGFRIELGEIEAVISQYSQVRETVVVVHKHSCEQQYLVAYLVPEIEQRLIISQLRSFLVSKLPSYMVPTNFVILDSLPLTPNGKVDRKALPELDTVHLEVEETYVAPQTSVEKQLAIIWMQVLGLEKIGINDNFFELGGHSLLATQVISRIHKKFDIELSLRQIFELPTIAKLAKSIGEKNEFAKLVPPIERVSREIALPLSFAQQRLWFLHQLDPESYTYNGSSAVLLKGSLNVKALEQSINEIARRHEILRTCFQVVNGQSVQIIVPDLEIPLPIVDLQYLPDIEREAEVQRLRLESYQKSFKLTQAPLLRLTILRLKTREYILLVTMHHIIFDAWSERVFIQELSVFYKAFSSGKPSPLTQMNIQYADFAVWQQNWLQGEVFDTLITYWEKQLEDNLPVLRLPRITQSLKVKTSEEERQIVRLSQTLSQAIKKLSGSLGTTLFMTLLAAFKILLYWYTGDKDIVVGTDIANRNRIEIENLIGFFVNQLVLRSNLFGNPNFSEFLQQVRQVSLEAYAHQDLPFEKLVSTLNPKRDLNQTPLFQVKFILQNAPTHDLVISDLSLTRLDDLEHTVARFDLLLELTDTEQGIVGLLKYNKDLFDANSIVRLLNSFETILSQVVVNPAIRLNELEEILIKSDREHQLKQEEKRKEKYQQKLSLMKRKAIDVVNGVEDKNETGKNNS